MHSLVLTAVVTPEHTMTVAVPVDVTPGPHQVVLLIQEDVQPSPQSLPDFLSWPAHPVALVDPSRTFRREDLYGDDGR